MKKNKTNLILIISAISLLITLGIFVYLLQVIKNKNKHISAVTTTLQEKIAEKDNLKALEKRISELGDTHKKIGSYLVDTSNIDTFVEFLENIGVNNGVDLSVKGVETPKGEKNKINMSVQMSGSFSNVTKLVSILENAPYSINITSLYLNKVVEQESVDSQNLNTKVTQPAPKKSYWQADVVFTVLSF